jgi:hypothetical protein
MNTDPQNAASEGNVLHYHITLELFAPEGQPGNIVEGVYTFDDIRDARELATAYMDYNLSILNTQRNKERHPDRFLWNTFRNGLMKSDGDTTEYILNSPYQGGSGCKATIRACDGDMVNARDMVIDMLARGLGVNPEDIEVLSDEDLGDDMAGLTIAVDPKNLMGKPGGRPVGMNRGGFSAN